MRVVGCALFVLGALHAGAASGPGARIDVHLEALPLAEVEGSASETHAHVASSFLGASPGRGAADGTDRQTQAPMVWVNLRKSPAVASTPSESYSSYASQRLTELQPHQVKGTALLRTAPVDEALAAMVGVFAGAPVYVTKVRPDVTSAGEFMRQLASQPGTISPLASRSMDSERHHADALCERDFAQPCPEKFVSAGSGKCAAGSSYTGPCDGVARSFNGLSSTAKGAWSEQCLAWWPCLECRRDFSAPCPQDWTVDEGSRCKPTAAYAGPCATATDFMGNTRDMLTAWSSACGAYWSCGGNGL